MKSYIKIAVFFSVFFLCFVKLTFAQERIVAPDFKLKDLYQETVSLSSYKDEQPVVLFFWASWSSFCQNELSVLNNMYAGLLADGAEVLSINVGEPPDSVFNFVKSYNLAYRVLLDKDTAVAKTFGVVVPSYVLIDKEGYIVYRGDYFPSGKYKELILQEQ